MPCRNASRPYPQQNSFSSQPSIACSITFYQLRKVDLPQRLLQILTAKLYQSISICSSSEECTVAVQPSHLGDAWQALAVLQEAGSALSWLSSELLTKLFRPLLSSEKGFRISDSTSEEHSSKCRVLRVSASREAATGVSDSNILQCLDFVQGLHRDGTMSNLCNTNYRAGDTKCMLAVTPCSSSALHSVMDVSRTRSLRSHKMELGP